MNETIFGRMCDEKRRVIIVFYNHKTNEEYGRVSVITSEEITVESNGDTRARVEDKTTLTPPQTAPGVVNVKEVYNVTDGYIFTDNTVKCCDCGKTFDSTGRNFKFFTKTYVPFRVASLRTPVYLCEECEAKRLAEVNKHTGISCEVER